MPIIIAECCQNHKGDRNILKEMVWSAAEAGADYVKIQSMLSDDLVFRPKFEEGLVEDGVEKIIKRPFQPEYERLKQLDLSDDDHRWFIEECQKANIKPLTTVFSRSRVKFLGLLPWEEIKIASYDCASWKMLGESKDYFDTFFISTGSMYDEEIERTAEFMKDKNFIFLHCVTIYPTPLNELHLARLDYLKKFNGKAGFSDHSLVERDGILASVAALAYGADVIERHFTVLERSETKDGPVSINPKELRDLVDFSKKDTKELKEYIAHAISDKEKIIGFSKRELSSKELLNRDYYRGRFASRVGDNVVYNWEDKLIE